MGTWRFLLWAPLLAACSSTTTAPAGPACEPDGTYQITPQKTGGTCPKEAVSEAPYTVTISTDGEKIVAGLQNAGIDCPGTIKDCKATIACTGSLKNGGTNTQQISWTFDAKGLTGTTSVGFMPDGLPNCNVDYSDTGTRK